ncbi:MAG: bifunctional serine/threonine-protein kinase/formylglycine-generating enzyme family protein [Spirosomataceae bacterium]
MNYNDFITRFEYNPDLDMLGEGGFGTVYKAYDRWRHQTIALKVVRFRPEQEQFSLLNEFELARNLQHPNIAYYSECYRIVFPQQGMHEVAIMKYYEAGHLGQLLKKNILSPAQKHLLIEGILAGVNYLHSRRPVIIHRDLKPSNILILEENNVLIPLITDFGISRKAKDSEISYVTVTTMVGSINFAAPEQWEGAELRPNADLWSLGVLISFICLDGQLPFRSEGINLTTESGQMEYRRRMLTLDWDPIANQIPEPYNGLIRQCLVIDPRQRVKSAADLVLPPFAPSISGPSTEVEKTGLLNSSSGTTKVNPKSNQAPGKAKKNPIPLTPYSEETGYLDPESDIKNSNPKRDSDQTGLISNPMDMLSMGVIPFPEEKKKEVLEPVPPKKSNKKRGIVIAIAVIAVAVIGAGYWYFKDNEVISAAKKEQKEPKPILPSVKPTIKEEMDLVLVEGGTFNMGSEQGLENEKPVHPVTLGSFWLGKTEVTVKQYRQFCQETNRTMPPPPTWGWKDDFPIVNVTWKEATDYCQWLSKKMARTYRLPTEAEWEYAARGGKLSKEYTYAGSNQPSEVSWYSTNTEEKGPRTVGLKKANELGLYDMSGNVWEWCADGYTPYSNKPQSNPEISPSTSKERVLRGGAWYYDPNFIRITIRLNVSPSYQSYGVGFRYVREE